MSRIKIICHRPGMRRCGQAHEAECVYASDAWTDEQLRVFDADPHFTVMAVDDPKDSSKEPGNNAPEGNLSTALQGEALTDAIIAVIRKLETGVKPTVALMKARLGFDITGKQLGEAIRKHKANTTR